MPKIKLPNDGVRKAYYELSDKISQAQEILKKLDDPEIKAELKKLEESRDNLYALLDQKYIWD